MRESDDIGVDRQLAQYIVQFFRNAVDDDDSGDGLLENETFHKIVDIAIFGMDKFVFDLLLESVLDDIIQ